MNKIQLFFVLFDIGISFICTILGILILFQGKSASKWMPGFNKLEEKDKVNYKEEKIATDLAITFFIMAVPFFAGALLDVWKLGIGTVIEFFLFTLVLLWHIYAHVLSFQNRYRK